MSASAGPIFDHIARALIDDGASETAKRQILGPLIDSLQAGHWDTENESLQEFSDDAVIVDLFAQRGIHPDPDLHE